MTPLKAGVIGVGHLGQHHARIYASLPGVQLVGVAVVARVDLLLFEHRLDPVWFERATTWTRFGDWLRAMEEHGVSPNVASASGPNNVLARRSSDASSSALGCSDRSAYGQKRSSGRYLGVSIAPIILHNGGEGGASRALRRSRRRPSRGRASAGCRDRTQEQRTQPGRSRRSSARLETEPADRSASCTS